MFVIRNYMYLYIKNMNAGSIELTRFIERARVFKDSESMGDIVGTMLAMDADIDDYHIVDLGIKEITESDWNVCCVEMVEQGYGKNILMKENAKEYQVNLVKSIYPMANIMQGEVTHV